jgi:hypothetical protein
MAYKIRWYIQDRVVFTEVEGAFSLDELATFTDDIITNYLDQGQAPVHCIGHMSQMTSFPTQVNQVLKTAKAFMKHPKMGVLIIVGHGNPIMRFVGSMVSQASKVEFYVVETESEALERLNRLDSTLNLSCH